MLLSGIVLGRDGGIVHKMIIPFWFGAGGRLGTGKQWFPWIHVHDIANIIKFSMENDKISGVLNGVAPEAATSSDFTRAFARALWRPAILPMPAFVINQLFGAERGAAMLDGPKVIPKRTLEAGYKYLYPDLKTACVQCAWLVAFNALEADALKM